MGGALCPPTIVYRGGPCVRPIFFVLQTMIFRTNRRTRCWGKSPGRAQGTAPTLGPTGKSSDTVLGQSLVVAHFNGSMISSPKGKEQIKHNLTNDEGGSTTIARVALNSFLHIIKKQEGRQQCSDGRN